ncbi:GDSL esterase/lipase [Parasponia andersonii]|uniref:GDSL esterase/lipase n=1 Tax=Parasponia andersonii TaxID=3476 RepID=A0A2P5DJE8_PARAD|nr:GDSL esterase/lipase [Parasponia andersonii]
MEPVAFVVDKFKGLGNWTHDLLDGLLHRRRQTSARRNPIEILKRLQRESFSDLMKLRDRQDKVERVLSLYKTAKGSPFGDAATILRGEVDLLGGFLMMMTPHSVEPEGNNRCGDGDVLARAGLRTGLDSRFTFETTIRDNDTLVVEFVSSQKNKNDLGEGLGLGSPLSLSKVLYMENASDWLSTFLIPMGAKCSDVAILKSPSHQGKGLTDISYSGPSLLNQHNGGAVGLMVKQSNFIASLAQFVSRQGMHPDSDSVDHCFSTFGQLLYQLPRGTKLSLMGLLQVPKLSRQPANHGPFTLSLGGYKRQETPERMVEEFVPTVGTSSRGNVPTGSIALMLESEIDEFTKIGGWIELKNSDPKYLKWAASISDDSEELFGWGMKFGGMIEGPSNFDHFQFETYMKFNLGKRFSIKPGVAYIRDGNARATALMLRSNWSL